MVLKNRHLLWSVLLPEATLVSEGRTAAGGGLFCHWRLLMAWQRPCRRPWPVLPLTVKAKEATSAVVSMTVKIVEKEGHRRLL